MSIDYDQLRADLAGKENGTPGVVHCTWPDVARELLRLRDGIEVIRDRCANLARSARAAGMHTLANEMYVTAKALTGLLNGDTE